MKKINWLMPSIYTAVGMIGMYIILSFGGKEKGKGSYKYRIEQRLEFSNYSNEWFFYTVIYNDKRIVNSFTDEPPITDSIRKLRILEAKQYLDTLQSVKDTTIYIK